jgi:hypothetical protein
MISLWIGGSRRGLFLPPAARRVASTCGYTSLTMWGGSPAKQGTPSPHICNSGPRTLIVATSKTC